MPVNLLNWTPNCSIYGGYQVIDSYECMMEWFGYMDNDNEKEWMDSLFSWWNNQWAIAVLGPEYMAPWSFFMSFIVLFGGLPTKENSPWLYTDPNLFSDWDKYWSTFWFNNLWQTAHMSQPDLFFISQIFTLGASNFSDISIGTMHPILAWMYFQWNGWNILYKWPGAVLHAFTFFWIYWWQVLLGFGLGVFSSPLYN